jgi:hypothetical protein
MRDQDVHPSHALPRSFDVVPPRAAELLNLRERGHRLENRRDGVPRDFTCRLHEIILTPAGIRAGWDRHARSKVIVITTD